MASANDLSRRLTADAAASRCDLIVCTVSQIPVWATCQPGIVKPGDVRSTEESRCHVRIDFGPSRFPADVICPFQMPRSPVTPSGQSSASLASSAFALTSSSHHKRHQHDRKAIASALRRGYISCTLSRALLSACHYPQLTPNQKTQVLPPVRIP